MVEHEFGVSEGDKQMIYQLMDKDLFLFPTDSRVSTRSILPYLNDTEHYLIGHTGTKRLLLCWRTWLRARNSSVQVIKTNRPGFHGRIVQAR